MLDFCLENWICNVIDRVFSSSIRFACVIFVEVKPTNRENAEVSNTKHVLKIDIFVLSF